jgi:dipeptidyl-peptidase-4
MLVGVEYPELADRTGRFRFGAPHALTVGDDGARVAFLRSDGPRDPEPALWSLDVATAALTLVAAGPVHSYAGSAKLDVLAWAHEGRLFTSTAGRIDTAATVLDPRPDPAGRHIGYLTPDGCLRVITGSDDQLIAGEADASWGVAEPAAAEFGRDRGWWWSPDGTQILAVRSTDTAPSLHLLDLFGGWVDVHWDRETYPYLTDMHWSGTGHALITVLRRTQQHGLVLSIDPRTGETQVHAELADARWVEPLPGTPRQLPDGRIMVGGELAHDGFDARCLFADGSLITPPGLYIRRVAGVLPRPTGGPEIIIEGTEGEPAEQHVFAVRTAQAGGVSSRRLTAEPGWHTATVGGDVLVVDLTVIRGPAEVRELPSVAEPLPYAPRPVLERVTDRRLPSGVLYPTGHVTGTRLPVLLELGEGPGHQQVVVDPARWQERQWWADAGFIVVSVDSRGTPGVAPSFEKVIYRRLADVALTDHIDALRFLTGKHPDLDLSRVAVRGTRLGGWLAAVAVQRRHDIFRCGVAVDPITDWAALPTAYAERYLGSQADNSDVYHHHRVEPAAAGLLISPAGGLSEELAFVTRECA